MKLIQDIIARRIEVMKDFDLNNQNGKSIWTFYQLYKLSINILGHNDKEIKNKDNLLKKIIIDPHNIYLINKIKEYMSNDNIKIEMVINTIKESEQTEEVYEDFYPVNIIGVNLDER